MIIRQATVEDAAGIAKVYVDGWHSTYPGIIPEEYLASMSYQRHEDRWAGILHSGDGFVYIAEDETGEIVGFIWGGEERSGDPLYTSELHAIYIQKSHQRQGLGRRLTQTLVKRLQEEGFTAMLVWVLAANASRRFYEALGAEFIRTGPYYVDGTAYDDTAYGWKDIVSMLAPWQ